MQYYAGIDLHSSNNYLGIIDAQDKIVFGKRLDNHLSVVLSSLEPFKDRLDSIVIESTYNWYWLSDGLQQEGYHVKLANPSAIKQYDGLKYTDDKWDSYWLAHMNRLNILPQGYIYPKELRPIRDLMRRRMMYVQQKTSHILSLQSMLTRNLGCRISASNIYQMQSEDIDQMFDLDPTLAFTAKNHLNTLNYLKKTIKSIEHKVLSLVKLKNEIELLHFLFSSMVHG